MDTRIYAMIISFIPTERREFKIKEMLARLLVDVSVDIVPIYELKIMLEIIYFCQYENECKVCNMDALML